ncbi:MAG: hypothetical protein KY453_03115 [Gemmatimonadetes bacterium]|nr:hypothetical protein [Gemmatimonadota bacterium]
MPPRRVDFRRTSRPAGPHGPRRDAGALVVALVAAACATPPPPPPDPAIDAERAATVLRLETRMEAPARIVFTWSLDDRDLRLNGRGIARVEPPYRARLDLFLANGEAVVAAALVGSDLRLPRGAPEGIIPPPDLLWGALGVFNPGPDAALLGGDAPEPERIRLRYGYPDGTRLHYTVAGTRIYTVELLREGRTVQRVVVEPAAGDDTRYPERAVYRDVPAFRELTITRESVENVEAYPPDIWIVR